MSHGKYYSVSVTMTNTGNVPWTQTNYHLGSQNPRDNFTWGTNRAYLPAAVQPGGTATFTFTVRAPSSNGDYNFQWLMVQEGVQWFGQFTPNFVVHVQ
jgi:hypothetical protein